MISSEDSYSTYEYSKFYKILPQINDWSKDNIRIKDGTKFQKVLFIVVIKIKSDGKEDSGQ